jgi:hypothetical protein
LLDCATVSPRIPSTTTASAFGAITHYHLLVD